MVSVKLQHSSKKLFGHETIWDRSLSRYNYNYRYYRFRHMVSVKLQHSSKKLFGHETIWDRSLPRFNIRHVLSESISTRGRTFFVLVLFYFIFLMFT